tara:strand:+ start:18 stop:1280 length:1263 start_codon:yes stop_codon:yes gene_type:complete
MDSFRIKGPAKLSGEVSISGSKNAALPIMVATIARSGIYKLNNIPNLRDTRTMIKLIETIGGKVKKNGNQILIDTKSCNNPEAPYELVKTMRASFYVLGPLLSRFNTAKVSLPGGCAWGPRPVDYHIKAFKQMGASVKLDRGYIKADGKLKAGVIDFKVSSVGATGNVLMGCMNVSDEVIIKNAAREPEIVDLCEFLIKMGMTINGLGTSELRIKGCNDNVDISIEHDIIPDRIEAGTFLASSIITQSKITIKNINLDHLQAVLNSFKQIGLQVINQSKTSITVKHEGDIKFKNIKTDIYPGFPTDMQPQWIALMCLSNGLSKMEDTIYHDRFSHIPELLRLGANIKLEKNIAIITGVDKLMSADVMCTDLRAGAALVLASLAARGSTTIGRIYHVDRGYEDFEKKLEILGVDVKRINSN